MEVPTPMVQKIANRHGRLVRLHELGAPPTILENEERMLKEVLSELRSFAIEHGAVPAQADIEEAAKEEEVRHAKLLPRISHALPHVSDQAELNIVASILIDEWGNENPTNDDIHAAFRKWKETMEPEEPSFPDEETDEDD